MRTLPLKPNHKRIAAYHASLADFAKLGVKHETAVRAAFQSLLEDCTSLVNKGRADKWKLVPEYSLKTKAGAKITPDGALLDSFRLTHGLWEAKDTADDLDQEIAKKFKLGYPRDNILFQSPTRAVLVQDRERALDLDITKPDNLVEVLRGFFEYQPPAFDEWEKAVAEFKDRLPEIGRQMTEIIRTEKQANKTFAEAFTDFVALCRQALNPNLAVAAVEEMLIQHLLTERIFRKIFVGTGNFMVNLIRRLPKTRLEHKYRHELHCNEVMLLPYYVAAMNIEHTFYEQIGRYEAFPGICLVDTFETAEKAQAEFGFFNPENTERVKRQKAAPIFVVLGNPPYNAHQIDENDNNKNRKYEEVDRRIRNTYAADSEATLKGSLGDPYIKAFRWASDRIKDEGIVAYVSNSGFVEGIACDGMRKHLGRDFDALYVIDLGGNVRKNPTLSGTTHNVFGIQVGVSISLLIRHGKKRATPAKIYYNAVPIDWRREEKTGFLEKSNNVAGVNWKQITPDRKNNWVTDELDAGFSELLPIGSKAAKQNASNPAVFKNYCNGAKSNSDAYVYDFDENALVRRAEAMVENYSEELTRWRKKGRPKNIENFLKVNEAVLKWVRHTKKTLLRNQEVHFDAAKIRTGLYRPFCKMHHYFEGAFHEDLYQLDDFFPNEAGQKTNRVLCVNQTQEKPFCALITNCIPNLVMAGGFGSTTQCFPFYTYDGEESARRENIRLSTLVRFQHHYDDEGISKWDIFHYVYAVLHHPEYRTRYAANLRRELPRIPLLGEGEAPAQPTLKAGSKRQAGRTEGNASEGSAGASPSRTANAFHAFAATGKKLADLHVNYEQAAEYPLQRIENPGEPLNWRVGKMRLTKDKTGLVYNDFLTLAGIPEAAFSYRLGNRSALEWVIDQYQISADPRSGLTNDPNREDEPES